MSTSWTVGGIQRYELDIFYTDLIVSHLSSNRLNIVRAAVYMYSLSCFSMRTVEAMDRIHRLGQHRPVRAIKLVIEDSIESRIVQVGLICCLTCMFMGLDMSFP